MSVSGATVNRFCSSGLQAIASARRLGAIVSAFDVRPAVREEVQSLGATFVEAAAVSAAAEGTGGYARQLGDEQQRNVLLAIGKHLPDMDLVITTAQIPGKPAPRPFRYFDKGNMAVVGKNFAVLQTGRVHVSGLLAWFAWAAVHLQFLA